MKKSVRHIIGSRDFRELSIFLFFVLVAFSFWYMQEASDKDSTTAVIPTEVNESDAVMSDMSFDIPIRGINMPAKTRLKTFPSKTKVSFLVELKKIHEVKASDFDVVIDYATLPNNAMQAEVRLDKSPTIVRHIEFHPTSVEILIEKQ